MSSWYICFGLYYIFIKLLFCRKLERDDYKKFTKVKVAKCDWKRVQIKRKEKENFHAYSSKSCKKTKEVIMGKNELMGVYWSFRLGKNGIKFHLDFQSQSQKTKKERRSRERYYSSLIQFQLELEFKSSKAYIRYYLGLEGAAAARANFSSWRTHKQRTSFGFCFLFQSQSSKAPNFQRRICTEKEKLFMVLEFFLVLDLFSNLLVNFFLVNHPCF